MTAAHLRPGQLALDAADLWPLLLHSVRYAMGRRSTAPATACAQVRRYGRHLRPEQLAQIAGEIRAERELGDECDRREWMALAEWIDREGGRDAKR